MHSPLTYSFFNYLPIPCSYPHLYSLPNKNHLNAEIGTTLGSSIFKWHKIMLVLCTGACFTLTFCASLQKPDSLTDFLQVISLSQRHKERMHLNKASHYKIEKRKLKLMSEINDKQVGPLESPKHQLTPGHYQYSSVLIGSYGEACCGFFFFFSSFFPVGTLYKTIPYHIVCIFLSQHLHIGWLFLLCHSFAQSTHKKLPSST